MPSPRPIACGWLACACVLLAASAASAAEWVWTPVKPAAPFPISISAAAISADGASIYAGGFQTYLYRSKDGGATWTASSPGGDWNALACSSDGKTVLGALANGGVVLSVDGGAKWTKTADPSEYYQICAISADGKILYAGVNQGKAFRSADAGATWTQLPFSDSGGSVVILACSADGNTVLEGNKGGRLRLSTDGGTTWKAQKPDGKDAGAAWSSGWVSDDGKTLLASTTSALYLSLDAGGKWTAFKPFSEKMEFLGVGGARDASLLVATTSEGVFTYVPSAAEPKWVAAEGLGKNHSVAACSKTGRFIFLGTGFGGLPYATQCKGASWTPVDIGNFWRGAAMSKDGSSVLAAGDDRLLLSTDKGATWKSVAPSVPSVEKVTWSAVAMSQDGKAFAAGSPGLPLQVSADAGASWRTCGALPSFDSWALAMTPDAKALFAAGAPSVIHKSADLGATWTPLYPAGEGTELYWSSVAADAAGTRLLATAYKYGVYLSADGGATWALAPLGAPGDAIPWSSACVSSDGQTLAVCSLDGRAHVSRDGGATWADLSPAATPEAWYAIACSADAKAMAVNARGGRLYLSTDSGASWAVQSAPAPNASLWSCAAVSADGKRVCAGIYGGGFHMASLESSPVAVTLAVDGVKQGVVNPAAGVRFLKKGGKLPLWAFPLDSGASSAGWAASDGIEIKPVKGVYGSYTLAAYNDGSATAVFGKTSLELTRLFVSMSNADAAKDVVQADGKLPKAPAAEFDPTAGSAVRFSVDNMLYLCDAARGAWRKTSKNPSYYYKSHDGCVTMSLDIKAKTFSFRSIRGVLSPFVTTVDGLSVLLDLGGATYAAAPSIAENVKWNYPGPLAASEGEDRRAAGAFAVLQFKGTHGNTYRNGDTVSISKALQGPLSTLSGDTVLAINGFKLSVPATKFEYGSQGQRIYNSSRDPDFKDKDNLILSLFPDGSWTFKMTRGKAAAMVRQFGYLDISLSIAGTTASERLHLQQKSTVTLATKK